MDQLIVPPPAASFTFTPTPVFALLDEAAARFPARPAIDFLGKSTTYAELAALTNRAAAGLQKLGVAKGAKIGLCLPNTPYFVIMYHAILKAGGTVVNFNPLYTEREIEAQARDSGADIIVTIDLAILHPKIASLAARRVFKSVIVCSMAAALPAVKSAMFRLIKKSELAAVPNEPPFIRFDTLISLANTPEPVAIDPARDIAALQFTGGTTGTPKAAMLTHANLTSNVRQILQAGPPLNEGAERILGILPLFHVFAMTGVMNYGLAIGAELLLLPRLDLKILMKTLLRRRPTIMPGVPTLFTAVSNAAEQAGITDLSFIKYSVSGGAPIPAEVASRFERISRRAVLEGYGLSETSPVVTATPPGEAKRGAAGRALPGTIIEIRDPDHPATILPAGQRGEICVRGPQVMPGYHNRPAETEAAFVAGALRTGDVGYLDEDGYLFIVDRIKDLILCGGYNVYPRVIEEAAYLCPDVQDAIAIGIPDAYRGQSPKLFVTLRPGSTATPEDIKTFLAGHLNKIEFPKDIEIRDSLPKTLVGKLSKKELVAEEAAKAA